MKMKTLEWKKIVPQLIATFGVVLLTIQIGIVDGWTSPNIARLSAPNATIHLTLSEASWLPSSLKLGRVISVILVPVLIELAGSKNAVLCAFIPVGLNWVLTMSATSVIWLYIARFFCGFTSTLAFSSYPVYLGEISSPSLRGTYLTVAWIGWPLGTLITSIAETYLNEVTATGLYVVPCILAMFLFLWLPASPYHLVKNRRMDDALESLAWYRGHDNVDLEIKEIIEYAETRSQITFQDRLKQLRCPVIRKSIFFCILVCMLPQICGLMNIFYYMDTILINGKFHIVSPSQIAIYINIILLVCNLLAINLLDKLGRRIVLITSCSVITLGLLILGLHYYLLNHLNVNSARIQWLPVVSIISLLVALTSGLFSAGAAFQSEMFAASVKSTASLLVALAVGLGGFVSTKSYQPLIDAIGESYVFWMYAGIMALAMIVLVSVTPETKGKSLQEVQRCLSKKKLESEKSDDLSTCA